MAERPIYILNVECPQHLNIVERTRVDKRVFWPQYFRKIEYVCLIGFRLTYSKRYHVFLEMTSELLIVHVPLLW